MKRFSLMALVLVVTILCMTTGRADKPAASKEAVTAEASAPSSVDQQSANPQDRLDKLERKIDKILDLLGERGGPSMNTVDRQLNSMDNRLDRIEREIQRIR